MTRILLGFLLCSLTSSVLAQAPTTPPSNNDTQGRALFGAGAAAYEAGRYDIALTNFQAAYELTARPVLLYNIGLAHDRLRHDDEALAAFRRFLAEVPDSTHREEVASRVTALEQAVAARDAEEQASAERLRVAQEEALRAEAAASAEAARAEEANRRAAQVTEDAPKKWWIAVVVAAVVVVGVAIGVGVAVANQDTSPQYGTTDFNGATFTLGGGR